MPKATIADVARLAGVSSATVSHVMNDTRFVADDTKNAVLHAIEILNYAPSHIARSLTGQRTLTVGLLITDVSNPFYHGVILGVEEIALAHDYSVFLFNSSYGQKRSLQYIRSMVEHRIDGIILMSSRLTSEVLTEVNRHKIPTVIMDWHEFDTGSAGVITLNFAPGIDQAVAHLVELGHTRFGHISGETDSWSARVRQEMFLKSLASRGIDPASVVILEGNSQIDGGKAALIRLVEDDRLPTAIFAVNDLTAFGILFEANRLGLSIPHDLSVIGLDNIALAAEVTPPLTTVALPSNEIGKRAMSMLLDLIEGAGENGAEALQKPHFTFDSELIVRASTSVPPRQRGVHEPRK